MRTSYFSVKTLVWLSVAMLVLIGLCKATNGFAFAVMIPITLAFIVQGKNSEVMFVILFSVFAMLFNPFFMPKTLPFVVCQKILLLSASTFLMLQVFGRRNSKIVTPFLGLFPYLIFMFFSSMQGWSPVVSNLKMFLFIMVYLGMYGSAVRAMNEPSDLRKLRSMYLFLALYILVGSLLVWPFKGISVMGFDALIFNPDLKSLYQGTTNHSQALGGFSAIWGTFLFCDWVFCIQRKSKLYLFLLILSVFFVYNSQSRTAMASFIGGVGFATLCAMGKNIAGRLWRRKMVSKMVGLGVLGLVLILAVPSLRNRALGFIVKYGDSAEKTEVTKETLLKSRQYKLEGALANWRQSPLIGNGFQVSEEMHHVQISGIKDMLSAPVEKSTWTYAVLEEGGVIGMILFVLFVVVAIFQFLRCRAYITATIFVEYLISNLGEFTIFSMSGGGGVGWCLVFMATVFDFKRLKQEDAQRLVLVPVGRRF